MARDPGSPGGILEELSRGRASVAVVGLMANVQRFHDIPRCRGAGNMLTYLCCDALLRGAGAGVTDPSLP